MGGLLDFIAEHQATLGWLAGGLGVVAVGAWTVAKFFLKRPRPTTVSATNGAVAAGRDMRGNTISTHAPPPAERPRG